VYLAYNHEVPSKEDLKSIKVNIFPGSARAVYEKSNTFVDTVSEMIRDVIENYPEIKLFGSCFGHQIFAHALGGKVEQMTSIPEDRKKVIGRELIQLTDPFYELPYVSSYMKKKGYTRETLPALIM
jgi:GMP synthase-like glutamine amidotransferase